MTTWRLCRLAQRCRSCNQVIAVGDPLLDIALATSRTVRCRACAEHLFGEPAPVVIDDEGPDSEGLTGVRYQPSLIFDEGAVWRR